MDWFAKAFIEASVTGLALRGVAMGVKAARALSVPVLAQRS
jgi:hypothetical protein